MMRHPLLHTLLGPLLLVGMGLSAVAAIGAGSGPSNEARTAGASVVNDPRVIILKSMRRLFLFDGDSLLRSYPVDLGEVPTGPKWKAGDGRTPAGRFRVVSRNADSPFHRFIGLDYPDEHAVSRGLAVGLISPGEAASVLDALATGRRPDWTTGLGGGIGIHGSRRGRDWTAGCVALDDAQVEELFNVLRTGDTVEILP